MTHLSDALVVTGGLEFIDSMTAGLAVGATLSDLTFAASTTDTDTVDHEPCTLQTHVTSYSEKPSYLKGSCQKLGGLIVLEDTGNKKPYKSSCLFTFSCSYRSSYADKNLRCENNNQQ